MADILATEIFTSPTKLFSTGVVALGFPLEDPVIGLVIKVAILTVLSTATRDVYCQLFDGVEPTDGRRRQTALAAQLGEQAMRSVRIPWIGHLLHTDTKLYVDPTLYFVDANGFRFT